MFFNSSFRFIFIFFMSLVSASAHAAHTAELMPPPEWDTFKNNLDEVKKVHETNGLSYMITGGAVAIGGGILSAQSNDQLTKLTLSLIQSVGIAGIGYGAGLYFEDGPDEIFRDTIALQRDLTESQKNEITRNFLALNKTAIKRKRLITSLTYGLVAAFNTYNAIQTTDNGLRTVYWAVAGANAALSLSFAF